MRTVNISDLHAVLEYQGRATAVLLASTRPLDREPRGSMFTRAEMDDMDRAMALHFSPEAFAAVLVRHDKAAVLGAA